MQKKLCFLFTILSVLLFSCMSQNAPSQNITTNKKNEISKSKKTKGAKTTSSFFPENYFILDSAVDSSNSFGEHWIAFVLAPEIEKAELNEDELPNRLLLIIKKTNDTFQLVDSSSQIILCKNCGGVFGDPYNEMQLSNRKLSISNVGGSAWRWTQEYDFAFQNNEWQLVKANYISYFNAKDCNGEVGMAGEQQEEIRFIENKFSVIHTHDDSCHAYEKYTKSFPAKAPIRLGLFPGLPEQWPNGKINDADGLDE